MPARPITQQERDEILRRHAAGETRNGIARALGRSGQTISKVVTAAGGTFERREETRVATETRQLDLAARRVALAEALQSDAERLRQQLWEPHTYFDWGGKDHDFDTHTTPEPTPADKRSIMATVGTAVDKSLRLVPPAVDDGEAEVGSLLTNLFDTLRDRHGDG